MRERAHEILELGFADALPYFRVAPEQLASTAAYVADIVRNHYPGLKVPLHARWRHFVFGGRNLWTEIAREAQWTTAEARARAEFDLAIVSVLLDAGAGPDWRYDDATTGLSIGRSEGLAIASLRMFEAGLFSADPSDPLRADAERLVALTGEDLARGFGVHDTNPLPGLEGRATLLRRLGHAMMSAPGIFAGVDVARAGGLFDYLNTIADGGRLPAPAILQALLVHLAPIWPNRLTLADVSLGDCWRHSAIKRGDETNGLVPLHKLSQWLSYSLIEPLQTAGVTVSDIDSLTGLAEYRNGGLFIDGGVIALRDLAQAARPQPAESELVVEWRALTIALLDSLHPLVRNILGAPPRGFPLGALLEGGTWAAGRKLAREIRADGRPPLQVISDGTVF